MQPDTAHRACLCDGTGAYTVEIVLADAVVSDRRLCLVHGLRARSRVYDSTTGRLGVVMEVAATGPGDRAWLRPPGGGLEWSTTVGSLRPPQESS
jgi:hypothetical protein